MGNGANQFFPGQEGFLGFTTNGNYGWMGANLSANAGGSLVDWAYETGGGSIAAGNIRQAAPSGGASAWTLTANGAESPTLGSAIADGAGGSYVSSVTKTGSGTWTLGTNNTFTGTTTINGGTLRLANPGGVALSGTTGITVNNGWHPLMGANNQVNLATTPPIALVGGKIDAGGFSQGGAGAAGQVGLGALTLTGNSIIDLAGTSLLHFANSTAAT